MTPPPSDEDAEFFAEFLPVWSQWAQQLSNSRDERSLNALASRWPRPDRPRQAALRGELREVSRELTQLGWRLLELVVTGALDTGLDPQVVMEMSGLHWPRNYTLADAGVPRIAALLREHGNALSQKQGLPLFEHARGGDRDGGSAPPAQDHGSDASDTGAEAEAEAKTNADRVEGNPAWCPTSHIQLRPDQFALRVLERLNGDLPGILEEWPFGEPAFAKVIGLRAPRHSFTESSAEVMTRSLRLEVQHHLEGVSQWANLRILWSLVGYESRETDWDGLQHTLLYAALGFSR